MYFRTTSFASSNQALRFSAQYRENILEYQHHISSGQKIHRSSDDPIAFRQISSLTTRLQELKTDAFSIDDSETKLNASVSQLQDAHSLVVRAKTLAQQGIQATNQSERDALATEVEGLLISLQDIAKTKVAGSHLYSGTRTQQDPFEYSDPIVSGSTLSANYLGADQSSRAYIGDSISIETFLAGDKVFSDPSRGQTLMNGSTGAKLGTGTDSLIGRADLQVRHTNTSFEAGSGVVAGVDSPGNDTLLGALGQNSLRIVDQSGTGDFGEVSINGGEPVAWTRSDRNLEVVGNNGGMLHLDLGNVTAGFDGTVDFASNGTLSVDGGLTTTAIDFSVDQTVVDSTSSKRTHIDTSEINRTGVEHLEFPGTSDVFQAMYELSLDLRNSRDLDNGQNSESLDRRLGDLDRLGGHLLEVLGRQAASLQILSELEFRVEDLQVETEVQVSDLQSTDLPATVLRLQNDQSLLEFTYAVTSQIASTSLLDFLR